MNNRITKYSCRHFSGNSKWVPSSGTYPAGFVVNGIETQVKKSGNDLTLVTSIVPCTASTVFTKNSFCAAPVQLSKIISKFAAQSGQGIHGIVINSGCANACTGTQSYVIIGEKGLDDAKNMVQAVDAALKLKSSNTQTLVCSTGVIGQNLQMDKILAGIEKITTDLGSEHDYWLNAASGIMTTDTFPKLLSREIIIGGKSVRIAGICKGAGMIHPNMATMLGIICTDVAISQSCLDSALKYSVDRSFNAISVDGDTSTNDSLAILANGASGCIKISDVKSAEYLQFEKELTEFSQELSQLIVRDGEGATKFVEIVVKVNRLNKGLRVPKHFPTQSK
jgi:glutamate N-acetyltransferase/amino-acid N-acetyltransferase